MLIPAPRLIWILLAASPLVLFTGESGNLARLMSACAAALAAAALYDILSSRRVATLIGARLEKDIRLYHLRPDVIRVELDYSGGEPIRVWAGLHGDEHLQVNREPACLALPGAGSVTVEFAATPAQRGDARIEALYLEIERPYGLFRRRRRIAFERVVSVWPDIGRQAVSIYSSHRLRALSGARRARLTGRGREFDQLREYLPSDAFQDIHWKATARRGSPVTKIFRVEKTQSIYAVVDTSRLSKVSFGGKTFLDHASEAILHLALRCEREGDLFGLIHFSSRVQGFIPAGRGKLHFKALRRAASGLTAEAVTPNYDDLMVFIRRALRRRSLLLLFTDLSDPSLGDVFKGDIQIVTRKHLSAAVMFRPSWARPLFSGEPVESVDDIYRNLGGHMGILQIERLRRDLKRAGVDLLVTEPDRLTADAIDRYLRIKERQMI